MCGRSEAEEQTTRMTNDMPSQASNIRIRTTAGPSQSPFGSTNPEQADEQRSGRPLRRSRQWIQLARSSRTAADTSDPDAMRARSDPGSNGGNEEGAPDRGTADTPPDGTQDDFSADCGQDTAGERADPARRSDRDQDPLDFMVELTLLPARMTAAAVAETLEYLRRVRDADTR
jgi:hypothetical protein